MFILYPLHYIFSHNCIGSSDKSANNTFSFTAGVKRKIRNEDTHLAYYKTSNGYGDGFLAANRGAFGGGIERTESEFKKELYHAGSRLNANNIAKIDAAGGSFDSKLHTTAVEYRGILAYIVDPEKGAPEPNCWPGVAILGTDKSDANTITLLGEHENKASMFAKKVVGGTVRDLGDSLHQNGWKQDKRTYNGRGAIKKEGRGPWEKTRVWRKKDCKFDTVDGPGKYDGTEYHAENERKRRAKKMN